MDRVERSMNRRVATRRPMGWWGVAITLGVAGLLLPTLAVFYTDWLWFSETGYQDVFRRVLTTQTLLGAAIATGVFVVLCGNLLWALRSVRPRRLVFPTSEGQIALDLEPARLRSVAAAAAGLVAAMVGWYASSQWLAWLMSWHATPFGDADPILGYDVGFYMFQLPLWQSVEQILRVVLVLTLAGVSALYYAGGALTSEPRLSVTSVARRHLGLLAAAFLLVLAFGAWLDIPALLTTSSGIINGATHTDVEARLPALRLLMMVALLASALAAYQAVTPRLWPIPAAVALYAVTALAGSGYAAAVQRFVVAPNEQVKETPFIEHNIAATRRAFGLDRIEERELSGDAELTRADIDANSATLKNVRLWDHQPLLDTFGQIQEIRTYYDFVSVDNDRYVIDGESRQVMLSARELNTASLPSRTWINERLTFTHGYGLTLGPVNQVTPEGLPVLFIKNLPPESSVDLTVTEPSLYFGERSNDYVFVKTQAREFHYPKGDDNVYKAYEGDGGVAVGSWFHKLLFAVRFGSLKILLSNDIGSESRVLYYRQIAERVNRIAPFLEYDKDPYLVLSDEGRLMWIQDAYTVGRSYPYSTPSRSGTNYIRNSVKVTIDAYHGTVRFYLADAADPVAATMSRMFPDLFKPLAEMPADLKRHLRYPEDIFRAQTAMYSTYHMSSPAAFYNKEDQWQIPTLDAGNQPAPMQPYYAMMKLPGETSTEFIQMLPFTPSRKDNLAAWMVARSDGDHYGRLMAFQFPKQKVIFGPRQVVARINQDQAISPQITLWNQQGSEVIQGTLLVIPIEESLLYIRPLYLRAEGGRIPELKRVIVAYQNQIVMEGTLEAALNRLFPPAAASGASIAGNTSLSSPPPRFAATDDEDSLGPIAHGHYQRAVQALRDGDWVRFGEEFKKLGDTLEQGDRK